MVPDGLLMTEPHARRRQSPRFPRRPGALGASPRTTAEPMCPVAPVTKTLIGNSSIRLRVIRLKVGMRSACGQTMRAPVRKVSRATISSDDKCSVAPNTHRDHVLVAGTLFSTHRKCILKGIPEQDECLSYEGDSYVPATQGGQRREREL